MQLPHSRLLRPEKWKVPWTPTRRYLWQLYLFIIVKNRKRRRGFQHVNFKQTGPLVSWNAAQQTKGTNCQCPQKPGYIAEELFWVKKSTYKDYVLNYPNCRTFSKRKKEKRWTWRLDEWLQGWGGTGRKCLRLGQGVTRDLCGGGSLLYLDCATVNFLVVIPYYSCARYDHFRELGKKYKRVSLISCNCMWVYNYLRIQSLV